MDNRIKSNQSQSNDKALRHKYYRLMSVQTKVLLNANQGNQLQNFRISAARDKQILKLLTQIAVVRLCKMSCLML